LLPSKTCCAKLILIPILTCFFGQKKSEFSKRTLNKGSGNTQKGAAHGEPHPVREAVVPGLMLGMVISPLNRESL